MKELTKDVLFSMVMGLVLPGMLLNFAAAVWDRAVETEHKAAQETINTPSMPVRVRREDGGGSDEEMDAYLVGVVLGEMPAYFEEEALKAQSVVARTYARKAYETGGKHGDGSVCTEPNCCQAWVSEEDYLQQGGTEENVEKIRNAVMATSGQVLTYEGKLIEATYFSCSGGSTEDAAAVWGTDYPYLQAVDSPGEEEAASYLSETIFSKAELEEKLGVELEGVPVSSVTYTQGGGVDTIAIGGKYFTGVEIREKLGLRSTAFSISVQGAEVVITTRGFGHRVGMSQYGADAMAVAGSTYEEILAHYYQGTELTQLQTREGK